MYSTDMMFPEKTKSRQKITHEFLSEFGLKPKKTDAQKEN